MKMNPKKLSLIKIENILYNKFNCLNKSKILIVKRLFNQLEVLFL